MRRSLLPIAAPLLTALAASTPARGQQCERPDLLDTVPADGATDVPVNARFIAHYDPRAEYLGEPVLFGVADGALEEIPAFFNENEGLVEATPPEPLEPGEAYRVEWPRLRGVGTASLGSGENVEFTAGDAEDLEPPRFDGLLDVAWRVDRRRDDCIDRRDERFVFDFELAPAFDDGGRDSLSLILFQTRGPKIDESSAATPIDVRAMPEDNRASVRLPVDGASGDVCFAAIVRDLSGRVSASGSQETCTRTRRPPFFQGCAAVRPRQQTAAVSDAAWAGLGLGLLAAARRRRTPSCSRDDR